MPEDDPHVRPSSGSARDERAAALERLHTLIPCGCAYVLDYDVNALLIRDLAHFLGNLLLIVVDAVVRAQFVSLRELRLVASSGNHSAVKEFGNLNRCNPYAGTCP